MCSQRLAKGVCGTEFVIGTVVFGREVRPVIYFVLTIFDTAEKSVQNLVFFSVRKQFVVCHIESLSFSRLSGLSYAWAWQV